jgi:hypothetical protein
MFYNTAPVKRPFARSNRSLPNRRARRPRSCYYTRLELLEAWIDERYRAVAPKRRVAELDALRGNPAQ